MHAAKFLGAGMTAPNVRSTGQRSSSWMIQVIKSRRGVCRMTENCQQREGLRIEQRFQ